MRFKKGSVVYIMHNGNIISKILRWFMSGHWSHSALIVDVSQDEHWLSETTDREVGYGRLSSYLNEPTDEVEIYEPLNAEISDIDKGCTIAEKNKGRLYAYWQLLSWAIVIGLRQIKINIPNFLPFGFVCNSHVLTALRDYKTSPFSDIKPTSIHTNEMYDMMSKSSNWVLVYKK